MARIGGEEFCIMSKGNADPRIFFEMLRRAIEAMEITLNDGTIIKITVSTGFTSYLEGTLDETLCMADKALYRAKEWGRNCVVMDQQLLF